MNSTSYSGILHLFSICEVLAIAFAVVTLKVNDQLCVRSKRFVSSIVFRRWSSENRASHHRHISRLWRAESPDDSSDSDEGFVWRNQAEFCASKGQSWQMERVCFNQHEFLNNLNINSETLLFWMFMSNARM